MHHGSKENWHVGLAGKLKPAVSIFSSDPNHKHGRAKEGHPHQQVLRDFWPWCPVRVDKVSFFVFKADLIIR